MTEGDSNGDNNSCRFFSIVGHFISAASVIYLLREYSPVFPYTETGLEYRNISMLDCY